MPSNDLDLDTIFDEKTVGIWFVSGHGHDWLCNVREIMPNDEYRIIYRFRYYTDKKHSNPFESKDKKNWFHATAKKKTRAYAISAARAMAQSIAEVEGVEKPYELLNNGDYKDFVKKFLDAPFVFAKMVPKES
jgi:hypothetical protein